MVTLKFVTWAPVMLRMMTRMIYERTITKRPTTAYVRVFLADSTFLGLPADVNHLKPPIRNIIKMTTPAKART